MIKPKTGWINVTTACNNRCVGCYAEASCESKKDESMMTTPLVKELLTCIKREGCRKCTLIGGEPTLHPDIIEIFRYGKQLGLKMGMVSNGRRFSSKKFCDDMVSVGLKTGTVTFSMHAPSDDKSVTFTGSKKAFSQFKCGLENLLTRKVQPGLNIVLFKPMMPYIEKMLRFAKSYGIKKVSFNLGAPSVETSESSFCLAPDELAEKVYEIFELATAIGVKTSFLFLIPFCLLEKNKMQRLLDANAISSGCQILSGSGILFNKDGALVPCNHMLNQTTLSDKETMRVLRDGKFSDFWNSEQTISFRKSACVYRSYHCIGCAWWDLCGGGNCSIFWTRYDPKIYIPGLTKDNIPLIAG